MENVVKNHKCPTLWLGVDTMIQNQAYSEEVVVEVRPDLEDCSTTDESNKSLVQQSAL